MFIHEFEKMYCQDILKHEQDKDTSIFADYKNLPHDGVKYDKETDTKRYYINSMSGDTLYVDDIVSYDRDDFAKYICNNNALDLETYDNYMNYIEQNYKIYSGADIVLHDLNELVMKQELLKKYSEELQDEIELPKSQAIVRSIVTDEDIDSISYISDKEKKLRKEELKELYQSQLSDEDKYINAQAIFNSFEDRGADYSKLVKENALLDCD